MKMRVFQQRKLWRDKIVELNEKRGSVVHWRTLNDAEFLSQLSIKLVEEANEVAVATSDQERIAELADVLEVIEAFCLLQGITWDLIKAAQLKKRNEFGGFAQRKYVEKVEHADGSFGANYCLAQPQKYPEITEE